MIRVSTPNNFSHVTDWYSSLPNSAKDIAQQADLDPKLSPLKIIYAYLNNAKLVEAFGGPTKKLEFHPEPEENYNWNIAIWGRRCSHYLRYISSGLLEYAEDANDPVLRMLGERISSISRKLRLEFERKRRSDFSLVKSVERKHGITAFHNTYLDPVLFTSLINLESIGIKFSEEYIGTPKYEDVGIKSSADFTTLQDELIELARNEVSLYTLNGKARSEFLADESTLWWGVYVLIRHKNANEFYFNDNKNLRGKSFAADFIKSLINWTREELIAYPTDRMARSEATAEIHCLLRTHLLIAKNALNLFKIEWPDEEKEDISSSLTELIKWSLAKALTNWTKYEKHAYFIGLALEVLSNYQSFLGDLDQTAKSPKGETASQVNHARLWTKDSNVGGKEINEAEYRDLILKKDEFDIFVVDDNEFNPKKDGIVYINKVRVSKRAVKSDKKTSVYDDGNKHLRSGGFRFLIHLLKNNGDAGTSLDVANAVWPHDDDLMNLFKKNWDAKKKKIVLRPFKEKELSDTRIDAEKSYLNDYLDENLKIKIDKIKGHHCFREKDMPNYCLIELDNKSH